MANYNIQTTLMTEQGKFSYSENYKSYETMYDETRTLANDDALIEVLNLMDDSAGTGLALDGAKLIKLVNSGRTGIEILITVNSWADGTPMTDSSAVYVSTIIAPNQTVCYSNLKQIAVTTAVSAANTNSRYSEDDMSELVREANYAVDTLNGAVADTDSTITVTSYENFHRDDLIICGVNDAEMEIMRIKEEPTSSTIKVERGMMGTTVGAHADSSAINQCLVSVPEKIAIYTDTTTIAASAGANQADPTSTENPAFTDSGNNFLSKGFRAGQIIKTTGFTTGANNGYFFISKAAAGTLYLHNKGANLSTEAAGDTIDITSFTMLTNQKGSFTGHIKAKNAADNDVGNGITPGSIAIKFATGGSASFGLSTRGSTGTNSQLTGGSTYKFGLMIDGAQDDISFTVDSNDTTLGGSLGIIKKMQSAIDAKVLSGSYWRGATVGLVNGDIVIKSKTNIHFGTNGNRVVDSAVAGQANQKEYPSGGISNVEIFPAQSGTSGTDLQGSGVFPSTPPSPLPSSMPDDTILDPTTQKESKNSRVFLCDDGYGLLKGTMGSGTINYETGRFTLTNCKPDAEFWIAYDSLAPLSGVNEYANTNANAIQTVKARSCNAKVDAKLRMIVLR